MVIREEVAALAAAAGVLTDWVDVWGESQAVTQDDLTAVLSALLQRPLDTTEEIVEAREDLLGDAPLVDPVIVAWDGILPEIALETDVESATVVTEDGHEIPVLVDDRHLTLERRLPPGYHSIRLGARPETALIIAAPTAAHPAPRHQLGVMAPVYADRKSVV